MLEALIDGRAEPEGPGGPGHRQDARQAQGARRGPGREVRGPPRRARPHAAAPGRRPDREIDELSARASELIAQIPAAWGVGADGTTGPGAGTDPDAAVLPAVARLDEITGCGIIAALAIIAEIGLDMTRLRHPRQAGVLGEAVPADPPVRQEDHRRLARQGRPLAQRAPRRDRRLRLPHRHVPRRALPPPRQTARQAKSPGRHRPLDPRHHLPPARRPRRPVPRPRIRLLRRARSAERKIRSHIRQLEALGLTVTITPAEDAA